MPFIQDFKTDTNSTRHMTPLPKVIFVVSIVDVELRIRRMKDEKFFYYIYHSAHIALLFAIYAY